MNINNKPYLTTLTPLRGIAAMLVVIFHSNLMVMPMFPRGEAKFIGAGWIWVDFFFILSGFIISYVYRDTFNQSLERSTYWKYIVARFARIYPLHFFTLIWSLVCAIIIRHYADPIHSFFATIYNPAAAPASLLLIQSLHLYQTPPLNTPSWSLSTEWWVYMIFPFLVPYFSRIKVGGKILTLLFIIGFYLVIKYVLGPIAQPIPGLPKLNVLTDFGLLRCLAGFLLGMLILEIYRKGIGYNVLKRSWCFIIIFAATVISMKFEIEDLFLVLLFFPLIILTAAYNNTTIKRILETPFLQRLGDWSFSIYMVHIPIAQIFIIFLVKANPSIYASFPPQRSGPPDFTTGLIVCIGLLVLTLITASLTYRYIEVPARNYINKLFKSRKVQGVTA